MAVIAYCYPFTTVEPIAAARQYGPLALTRPGAVHTFLCYGNNGARAEENAYGRDNAANDQHR
jgi:hypothetical protein